MELKEVIRVELKTGSVKENTKNRKEEIIYFSHV
jgi:hypothetical protein